MGLIQTLFKKFDRMCNRRGVTEEMINGTDFASANQESRQLIIQSSKLKETLVMSENKVDF